MINTPKTIDKLESLKIMYFDRPKFSDLNRAWRVFGSPFLIKRTHVYFICAITVLVLCARSTYADTSKTSPTLVNAVMCESIKNYLPVHPAVVFSISLETIICFTRFDPVPKTTDIFHKWYKKDHMVSLTKLTLKPPKWSSFSSMQLRHLDRGPWRVDIENADGKVLKTLRFSISD